MESSFQRIEYKSCVSCCGQIFFSSVQRPVGYDFTSSHLKGTWSGRWSWPAQTSSALLGASRCLRCPCGALCEAHREHLSLCFANYCDQVSVDSNRSAGIQHLNPTLCRTDLHAFLTHPFNWISMSYIPCILVLKILKRTFLNTYFTYGSRF